MKNFLFGCLAIALLVGVQAQADASIINIGDKIRLFDGPGLANGGEFQVKKNNANTNWGSTAVLFNTFCCELSETMNFNTTYRVNDLSTKTVASNKTLTAGTASLFRAYWNGMVANASSVTVGSGVNAATYDFGANRADDARALQLAIWKSMGFSITGQAHYNTSNAQNTAIKNKADKWIAHANAINSNAFTSNDLLGVRVMNLTNLDAPYSQNFQDQLVVVPEPGSFLIWTMVAAGMGSVVSRRRRV